jgi:signal transduction histidine kinase
MSALSSTIPISTPVQLLGGPVRRMLKRALRAPLPIKIVGANVLIAAATIAVALTMHATLVRDPRTVTLLLVAAVTAQLINTALVILALRPLRMVEQVAARVWAGEFSARVPDSPLADREMRRLGAALNNLLDGLMRERERIRHLAAEVIRAQDEERSRISRDLHDSIAQIMAGVVLQLSALEQAGSSASVAPQLREIREATAAALDEVRSVSQALHPRVLEELGLRAALGAIAHSIPPSSGVDMSVIVRGETLIPRRVSTALYRVAQEAVDNALRHSGATSVEIRLDLDGTHAVLEIEDNGRGFDAHDTRVRGTTLGLFSMRERVALVDGALEIDSAPGRGTAVRARVPLKQTVS